MGNIPKSANLDIGLALDVREAALWRTDECHSKCAEHRAIFIAYVVSVYISDRRCTDSRSFH